MNRLVIVGNGFDLAHGMKTGYNDFIIWYLTNAFTVYSDTGSYVDELMEIKSGTRGRFRNELGNRTIEQYVHDFYFKGQLDKLLQMEKSNVTFNWSRPRNVEVPYIISNKSSFLKAIAQTCSINHWVDLENLYYDELKNALSDKNKTQQDDVSSLNVSLLFIINQLQLYLSTINNDEDLNYSQIFSDPVNLSDVVGLSSEPLRDQAEEPQTLVVNFNYTTTPEKYINRDNIIYIHGQLNNGINSLVFGFGDELDSDYSRLEDSKIKDVFNYIKSFWYFKTSNYHNLIRFIDSGIFQVRIVGHSCGLSDRTMLNMIFEHENCKSIKIFYHEFDDRRNNYTILTQEISRHFKNKQQMRMKMVPFNKCSPMPQSTKV